MQALGIEKKLIVSNIFNSVIFSALVKKTFLITPKRLGMML